MENLTAEFLGTALLILLGNGVVANVLLSKTKGESSGWIVITMGWGAALFVAVLCVGDISGAHINPAVTIGLLSAGEIQYINAIYYIIGQSIGAFIACVILYLHYLPHWSKTEDKSVKLGVFATSPSIKSNK
mgnify:CR=1 FL=1